MNKFDASPQDSNSIIVELYLSKPKFQTKLYYFELSAKRRDFSMKGEISKFCESARSLN